jgi:hypothetical protein
MNHNHDLNLFKMIKPDLDLDDLILQASTEEGEDEEDGGYYPMLVVAP